MPHTIWKGDISFGLVNVPVQLSSALEQTGPTFHRLSSDGTCRLRQKLYCPDTNKEYDFGETAMGYEVAPSQYVILDRDELEAIKPDSGHSISILDFVELSQIDPIYFDRTYYLLPEERGRRAYRLLVEAMNAKGKIGIAKFIMRRKEYLAALRVIYESYLALETMYYQEEIRGVESLPALAKDKVENKELQLAEQLIDAFATDFEPTKYKNEYREQLEELLAKKAEGEAIVIEEAAVAKPGKVLNLMEALKRSVEQEKGGSRRESGGKAGRM